MSDLTGDLFSDYLPVNIGIVLYRETVMSSGMSHECEHGGKASERSNRSTPISPETISDSEKEPTPPPKSASLTPMRRKAYVTMSMDSERSKDANRKAVQLSNEGSDHDAPDNHDSDEVMNEKGRYAVRDDPATLKRSRRAHGVTRLQNFVFYSPSPNKRSKAIVISSDEEKQDSDESEVRREDESAIDFIRRQREMNPTFILMAKLTDQRDELDHEIERQCVHCGRIGRQPVNDFIDDEVKKSDEGTDNGWLNDDEALSEDDSLNGFIVDDDEHPMPQGHKGKEKAEEKAVKIQGKKKEDPPRLLDRSLWDDLLKDTYANIPYTLLMPVSLMQALTIAKNLVYARGIIELMIRAKPWPGQVIIPGHVHPDKLKRVISPNHGEMQIKELHIVSIMQEWELALGFHGMLFGHDIEDGGEMTVKNIRFSAFEGMSFSTCMSHTESNEMSSSYNTKLKMLLGEHSTSLRKAGPSTHSSPSEVLPLFPKPVLGNLAIGDTNVPATCPLLKMELPDCVLVAVLHTAKVWNSADQGDTMSFNILSVLLLLLPKS
ncbi:uncharacterized protein LAESUDRAFT_717953 [Laetiporus sulphureus 93-53]|uniref:Uncharacterized protein n=1 Tax=Laetiporus sulphureus 93-53 TaxID=1314785 RepID=A0A165BCS4_9APHY|nr:uncharacterized protein LAESUDRAFT_717953 [Laetiporus sulphureus 93-53]KZT00758.1 hypothetical protein LAESUDRAFT_717953 [Laetiporus sulphureus 93-53]